MIARLWRGTATKANASAYRRHFTETVVPQLEALPGHRGAWLLQRDVEGTVEILALTVWESLDAIHAFAGTDAEAAVIEPAALAVLSEAEPRARHYEIVHSGPPT